MEEVYLMLRLLARECCRQCFALAIGCIILSCASCRSSRVVLDPGWINEGSTFLDGYRPEEDAYPH